jgi:hypothetical protein
MEECCPGELRLWRSLPEEAQGFDLIALIKLMKLMKLIMLIKLIKLIDLIALTTASGPSALTHRSTRS